MLIPYLLILSSKENSDYSRLKFITFSIGMAIIIYSETTIRFVSNELFKNIFILITPILVFNFLYLILFFKLNFNFKK